MTRPILNLDELVFGTQTHGERFEARMAPVASRIGAAKLGYRVTQLPPGKRAWPFHSHHANEEMIFVLEGRGRLRLADGEHPIRAGDFIAAPAGGVETAHQIINDSDQPLTYLCVSTMIEPEVVQYPDSGKLGVAAGAPPGGAKDRRTLFWFGKTGEGCGYWEGE